MTPGTDMQVRPLTAELEKKEQDAIAKVTAWEVKTVEDAVALDNFLVGLAELEKKIIADFKDSKAKAFEAHKAIVAQEKAHLDEIARARSIGKPKLRAWQDEQERLRLEVERKAQEDARKKQEEDALAAAAEAEKQGDKETANAIVAEAVAAPAPIVHVAQTAPKLQTRTSSGRWGATVKDPLAVQKAVEAAGKVLSKFKTKEAIEATELLRQAHFALNYMDFTPTKLQKQADSTKANVKVLGVEFAPKA
jgi:hypothetical protein